MKNLKFQVNTCFSDIFYSDIINIASDAGFVVPITVEIMHMPGLPNFSAAENMNIHEDGTITGLF
jgi:formyltetrahydrofolate synthetase